MADAVLFLAAPPETYAPAKDTTRVLMAAAAHRGVDVWTATHADLGFDGRRPAVLARRLDLRAEAGPAESDWFAADAPVRRPLADFRWTMFRSDPPFDAAYLHATQLVELEPATIGVNTPSGLRAANEKLWALGFPELLPPTRVTRDPAAVRAFAEELGGPVVLKPIDGFGGQGIFRWSPDDPNARALIQAATGDGREPVIVQAWLEAAWRGDKRILLWDGEVVGAFWRIPVDGEFRGNMMQGGRVEHADIDTDDERIIGALRPALRGAGLRLVGLDVIGGCLTEVNVTSPTGFQEVRKLSGGTPEDRVWDSLLAEGP